MALRNDGRTLVIVMRASPASYHKQSASRCHVARQRHREALDPELSLCQAKGSDASHRYDAAAALRFFPPVRMTLSCGAINVALSSSAMPSAAPQPPSSIPRNAGFGPVTHKPCRSARLLVSSLSPAANVVLLGTRLMPETTRSSVPALSTIGRKSLNVRAETCTFTVILSVPPSLSETWTTNVSAPR